MIVSDLVGEWRVLCGVLRRRCDGYGYVVRVGIGSVGDGIGVGMSIGR